jgi:lipid A 3-O-deacylase
MLDTRTTGPMIRNSRMDRLNQALGVGGDLLNLGLAMAIGLPAPAQAAEPAGDGRRILAIGVFAHDRGFASDEHENGVNLNLEVLFTPLDLPGSPRPHLGTTLNFQGDTSIAYAGLSFRLREQVTWFFDFLLGAAVHDGPLHKDPVGCDLYSDCGFGIRIMPRIGLEAGYRVSPDAAVSLYFDHMSHKWIIGGENEGLEHIGLRYWRPF